MAIGSEALLAFGVEDLIAAEDEVLTHGHGGIGEEALGKLLGFLEGLGLGVEDRIDDTGDKFVEFGGTGNEVGLAVHLDDDGLFAALVADFDDR